MAEEVERRLSLSRQDKQQFTEIIQCDGDSIEEIIIKFRSGNIMHIK